MTASVIVLIGGAVATILGIYGPESYNPGFKVGHLLAILYISGITLTLAGIVDGGRRYIGAGIGLLYVAISASVISKAPDWLGKGWLYGALFMVWGSVATAKLLSERSRNEAEDSELVGEGRPSAAVTPDSRTNSGEPAAVR